MPSAGSHQSRPRREIWVDALGFQARQHGRGAGLARAGSSTRAWRAVLSADPLRGARLAPGRLSSGPGPTRARAEAARHITVTDHADDVAALVDGDGLVEPGAGHRPVCRPDTEGLPAVGARTRGLADVALALSRGTTVVGNDLDASDRRLLRVTGANQGGKSAFLRSLGIAQVVIAHQYASPIAGGVFTHYRREEDAGLVHGKLDEELAPMNRIIDRIRPGDLLLCNEPFASTNERDASQIARHVFEPLVDAGVRVAIVTHLFDLAHRWDEAAPDDALFLRARREPDGTRSYRLEPGAPQPTSYAQDVYDSIFLLSGGPGVEGAGTRSVPTVSWPRGEHHRAVKAWPGQRCRTPAPGCRRRFR